MATLAWEYDDEQGQYTAMGDGWRLYTITPITHQDYFVECNFSQGDVQFNINHERVQNSHSWETVHALAQQWENSHTNH